MLRMRMRKRMFVAAAITAALLWAGCMNIGFDQDVVTEPPRQEEGFGTAVVSLDLPETTAASLNAAALSVAGGNGPSRTLFPSDRDTWSYSLSFEYTGGAAHSHADIVVTPGQKESISLEIGTWTITAHGKTGGEEVAIGSEDAVITANEITTVPIILGPVTGGTGTLDYTVRLPAGVTGGITVTTTDGAAVPGGALSVNDGPRPTSATAALEAGEYIVTATASGNEGVDGYTDVVHIYKGQTTSFVYAPDVVNKTPLSGADLDLTGILDAPRAGADIGPAAIEGSRYTGVVVWKIGAQNVCGSFAAGTVYTAVVTMTAKDDYAFAGVAANAFRHDGADTSILPNPANPANAGIVTIVFPATEGAAPTGTAEVIIGFNDAITIDGVPESGLLTINKSGDPESVTLTASADYSSPRWYVGSTLVQSGATVTIRAADYTEGARTLTFIGKVGGRTYSRQIPFVVQARAPEQVTFATPAQYREMASIPAMTVVGSGSYGVFPSGRTVTLSAYQIARYETTYELWYEVRTWATANGYTLASAGCEGYDGAEGAAPTSAAKTEPVTYVSWRDVVVWCNAYSAMSGKTPAYYSDAACTTVIKFLSNDAVYVKSGANGYRLPTEAEWEAAARGGNPSAAAWSYSYAGSDTIGDVAWYSDNSGSDTHPVGTKAANTAGLYDMIGNVHEWCFDWYGSSVGTGAAADPTGAASGTLRVDRGGAWNCDAFYRTVASRGNQNPDVRHDALGFRVACAPGSEAAQSSTEGLYIGSGAALTPVTGVAAPFSIANALAWLKTNAQANTAYTAVIAGDETIAPQTLNAANLNGKTGVSLTLAGCGGERTVGLSTTGSLFTVESGVTLTLDENVTLVGRTDNTASLVTVNIGGTFVMQAGAKVTGNTNTGYAYAGGVYVDDGSFTMNGGEVSGNTGNTSHSYHGGGVGIVANGVFTMNGGKINNNRGGGGGGGVSAYGGGTFVMNGGEIAGNRADSNGNGSGGGVMLDHGLFTMNGGTIYGSTAYLPAGDGRANNGNLGAALYYYQGNASAKFGSSGGHIGSTVVAANGSIPSTVNETITAP